MKLVVEPGVYIAAVSGGVDSMALLHVLNNDPALTLVVAHYDHGIRVDSVKDRKLVEQVATDYGLPFVYGEGLLGPSASEAVARDARYKFLEAERARAGAQAIITAHHQDDVLETAVINMLRGTGRKGLSSLKSGDELIRPLLGYSKQQIRDYADSNSLKWREDSTNQDEKYLRNYVRLRLLSSLSPDDKQKLLDHVETAKLLNQDIDELLQVQLTQQVSAGQIDRAWFISLPHSVAREVMASWLRKSDETFDSKGLERLVTAAKTLPAGKQTDVSKNTHLVVGKQSLALVPFDR